MPGAGSEAELQSTLTENNMTGNTNEKLIIIAGPTAVGKSGTAVSIAERFNGEVVSADSMQIYKGMDIGTAKVTAEEMRGIRHHLIDFKDPHEDYNVVEFQYMASTAISDINSRGKLPVLCGGTGFYIQALLYGIDFSSEPPSDKENELRSSLREYAEKYGTAALHERLAGIDPESAESIPKENIKRVIRAIEFYELHGKKISEHNRDEALKRQHPLYDSIFIVLNDDRKKLYERIDKRVDKMLEAGLVDEVRRLLEAGVPESSTAMQAIGYREIVSFLKGNVSLDGAVELIKQNSRHYAKRQLTWFRREQNTVWLNIGECDATEEISRLIEAQSGRFGR